MSAVRSPGTYAVIDGVEHRVLVSTADYVKIPGRDGPVQHAVEDLDDLLSVGVRARWRGGQVAVTSVSEGRVRLLTSDRALADREGLVGDFRDGWYAEVPESELDEVAERVTSIHPRRQA